MATTVSLLSLLLLSKLNSIVSHVLQVFPCFHIFAYVFTRFTCFCVLLHALTCFARFQIIFIWVQQIELLQVMQDIQSKQLIVHNVVHLALTRVQPTEGL